MAKYFPEVYYVLWRHDNQLGSEHAILIRRNKLSTRKIYPNKCINWKFSALLKKASFKPVFKNKCSRWRIYRVLRMREKTGTGFQAWLQISDWR